MNGAEKQVLPDLKAQVFRKELMPRTSLVKVLGVLKPLVSYIKEIQLVPVKVLEKVFHKKN